MFSVLILKIYMRGMALVIILNDQRGGEMNQKQATQRSKNSGNTITCHKTSIKL